MTRLARQEAAARNPPNRPLRLLRFLGSRGGARPVADDEQCRVFILGAVPMHAFAEVRDERAFLEWYGQVRRVELGAGSDPPGARQHGDEPVVRMVVRAAEIVALLPREQLDVETRF